MFGKDGRSYFEFAAGGIKAWLAITPQQPLLPFSVLHHGCLYPRFAVIGTHLLQGKTAPIQGEPQQLFFALGVKMAVTETTGQLCQDQKVAACLPLRFHEPFPDGKERTETHVGCEFVGSCCRKHNIGICRIGRVVTIDADHEIKGLEGFAPQLRVGPGGNDRSTQHSECPHRVRSTLQHRFRQRNRMGLPAISAVNRETFPPQSPPHIRIGNKAAAVLGKDVLLHPK